uniref:alpha-N-acetylgalactosaminide alpha-2,6-sialyltransferase n=1 Tax=Pundamilia nyererei TaxID=303518 RepID=A0A3B4ETZ1_9CICH
MHDVKCMSVLMSFFSFAEVMASVKLIPKPKEPLLLPKPGADGCIHCAVVGTAGILNGSKVGAEIDAHDYVFRMNGAVIKGYEEDVGNRTSVYVHTEHSIAASPYFFGKYGYKSAPHDEGIKYVLIPEAMRDFRCYFNLKVSVKDAVFPYLSVFYFFFFLYVWFVFCSFSIEAFFIRRFLKSPNLNETFWPLVRPTNGAFTLFLALHTCDTVSYYHLYISFKPLLWLIT